MTTRVAFTLFGDDSWIGGVNYLRNLISALHEFPALQVRPVLFVAPQTPEHAIADLAPYLADQPITVDAWRSGTISRLRKIVQAGLLQCDFASLAAFRAANIDVVFQNDAWYGAAFPIPTVFWIADFQHKHLPEMFSPIRRFKRDIGYFILCRLARKVMVSSQDARKDCESYLPKAKNKIAVVPFAVRASAAAPQGDVEGIIEKYGLPRRYFYFPGQLWRHKNHLNLIEALRLLRDEGKAVFVVATGNPKDRRNPEHPRRVLELVREYDLESHFIFLGMVPYLHVDLLMQGAVALVNPSLFEGWSTTVEEAKACGVPVLLSGLSVHKEQTDGEGNFFDPFDIRSIADVLWSARCTLSGTSFASRASRAAEKYAFQRKRYAKRFANLVLSISNQATPDAHRV